MKEFLYLCSFKNGAKNGGLGRPKAGSLKGYVTEKELYKSEYSPKGISTRTRIATLFIYSLIIV